MATSAYLSWLQKRESKVSRSPSTPVDNARVERDKQEGGAYASWVRWRERQTPPRDGKKLVTPEKCGGDVSPRVQKSGKRPRNWASARKELDPVSLADEFAVKRRERVAKASHAIKSHDAKESVGAVKTSAPRTSSLPRKRKLETSVDVDESRKSRRVDTASDGSSSADEEAAHNAAASEREDHTEDDTDAHQLKRKTTALLVAECRYWTAVDRFSHLD